MSQATPPPVGGQSPIDSIRREENPVRPRRSVTAHDPLRVLLAEDSPIVSQRLVALIDALDRPIRVRTAASGHEAARVFGELQPDVAVLDIALPGLNGFDLLAAFKVRLPACVLIMLTTSTYPEFRENAARLGADFFFSKALEFERVTDVLASVTRPLAGARTDGAEHLE